MFSIQYSYRRLTKNQKTKKSAIIQAAKSGVWYVHKMLINDLNLASEAYKTGVLISPANPRRSLQWDSLSEVAMLCREICSEGTNYTKSYKFVFSLAHAN